MSCIVLTDLYIYTSPSYTYTYTHMHSHSEQIHKHTQVMSPRTEPVCKTSAFVNLTVENLSRSLSLRLVLAF